MPTADDYYKRDHKTGKLVKSKPEKDNRRTPAGRKVTGIQEFADSMAMDSLIDKSKQK